ncbi:hypothetical protein FCV25MIE_19177 [Fagus crenata]
MTDQKNQGQIELEGTTARLRRTLRKPQRGQEGSRQGGFVGSLMMVLWMSGFCGGVGLLVPDEFKVEGFVVEGGGGRESNCNCGEIKNKGRMGMGEGKGGVFWEL